MSTLVDSRNKNPRGFCADECHRDPTKPHRHGKGKAHTHSTRSHAESKLKQQEVELTG